MSNTMSATLFFVIALMLGLSAVGGLDMAAAEATQGHYCEMVRMHKQTGGEYGWPDYQGNYAEICED